MPSMEISSTSSSSTSSLGGLPALVDGVALQPRRSPWRRALARSPCGGPYAVASVMPRERRACSPSCPPNRLIWRSRAPVATDDRPLLGSSTPTPSADEITKEYIEVTVAEALEDLRTPGAGDFFGRIDRAGAPVRGATAGTSAAATSRTSSTIRWSSTGGRRSPRRSTAPRTPTRSGSPTADGSRWPTAS